MITDGIFYTIWLIVYKITDFLPDGDGFSTILHTTVNAWGAYINHWNFILPIGTVKTIILFDLGILGILFGYKIVARIMGFIRGTNPLVKL